MLNLKETLLENGGKLWSKEMDNGIKLERVYFSANVLNKIYKASLGENDIDRSLNENEKNIKNSKNYYDINNNVINSDTGRVRNLLRKMFGNENVFKTESKRNRAFL